MKNSPTNDALYKYFTPKLGENGSCSIANSLERSPYDLSVILGGKSKKTTDTLQDLNTKIQDIANQYSIDWLGIYQKRVNAENITVLVKLAYIGKSSRAEFPLTKEFSKLSNNAFVGLTGEEVLLNDVSKHAGSYYQCDVQVKSEFCAPLFSTAGEIIGIVDAESFTKGFFNLEVLSMLRNFCSNISEHNLPN